MRINKIEAILKSLPLHCLYIHHHSRDVAERSSKFIHIDIIYYIHLYTLYISVHFNMFTYYKESIECVNKKEYIIIQHNVLQYAITHSKIVNSTMIYFDTLQETTIYIIIVNHEKLQTLLNLKTPDHNGIQHI